MKSIQINIPEGFEVDKFDTKTGEITFKEKPKNVIERINSLHDILDYHGKTMEAINEVFKNVPEHLKYQYIAELGCEILNEGWIPNWDDRSQLKYFIWFKMGSSGFRYHDYAYWSADSLVGSRLCFKKLESAKHLATIINDVFEKFMIIK